SPSGVLNGAFGCEARLAVASADLGTFNCSGVISFARAFGDAPRASAMTRARTGLMLEPMLRRAQAEICRMQTADVVPETHESVSAASDDRTARADARIRVSLISLACATP